MSRYLAGWLAGNTPGFGEGYVPHPQGVGRRFCVSSPATLSFLPLTTFLRNSAYTAYLHLLERQVGMVSVVEIRFYSEDPGPANRRYTGLAAVVLGRAIPRRPSCLILKRDELVAKR